MVEGTQSRFIKMLAFMKIFLILLFIFFGTTLKAFGEPTSCPDNFNLKYLAQDSMTLCYDEYVNENYILRVNQAFNDIFDYDTDGIVDLEEAYKFLNSEKRGLILISSNNEKYLDQYGDFHHGAEEELGDQFPNYAILQDNEFFGTENLSILERPAWLLYESLTYNSETDPQAQAFKEKLWELALKITDTNNFPFLLRLGIQGSEAKWKRYQAFSFAAVPCDRDCISEDLFYLSLLTLRNTIDSLGTSAALSERWGWQIQSPRELDNLFPEFRSLYEKIGIPLGPLAEDRAVANGSSLRAIALDEDLTEIFKHQVDVAHGEMNIDPVSLKNKNWAAPESAEKLLTEALWVRFATTKGLYNSQQGLFARIGCVPLRVIVENPHDYYQDYRLHPYDIEFRKIQNDPYKTSSFPSSIEHPRLGTSINYVYLDCSEYAAAQEYLHWDGENWLTDIFDAELPILVLSDYRSAIEGENISFVKKVVASVMVTLFLLLFLYDRKTIYMLVTLTFLLEIAKEIMVDWHYAALLQWAIVPLLVTMLSETNNKKLYSLSKWLFGTSVFLIFVGFTDTIFYKMKLTEEDIALFVQASAFMLIVLSIFLSVTLCVKSVTSTNKRSLMGLIFMVPFMFDFGVVLYRNFAATILDATYDIEVAFDLFVRVDEAYYELYLKVFAAALTGLILVARNDLFQRQAIFTQKQLTSAYQRFVPEEILTTLGKGSILELNLGDQIEQNMSILFSDIREFTATSEKLSPERNFKFINDYLEIMVPIVRKNNGFVDKFIGDAIMAIFPENADDAIRCALEMQAAIPEVNTKISEYLDEGIEIGIGINTGKVRLGTLGAMERMEGSVISDAVNLAARVEQLTKQYPENIIVTEYTQLSASKFTFTELDAVTVKGKSNSVKIYGVSY